MDQNNIFLGLLLLGNPKNCIPPVNYFGTCTRREYEFDNDIVKAVTLIDKGNHSYEANIFFREPLCPNDIIQFGYLASWTKLTEEQYTQLSESWISQLS